MEKSELHEQRKVYCMNGEKYTGSMGKSTQHIYTVSYNTGIEHIYTVGYNRGSEHIYTEGYNTGIEHVYTVGYNTGIEHIYTAWSFLGAGVLGKLGTVTQPYVLNTDLG